MTPAVPTKVGEKKASRLERICGKCGHLRKRHGDSGCEARRSCGPVGTFRCGCEIPVARLQYDKELVKR